MVSDALGAADDAVHRIRQGVVQIKHSQLLKGELKKINEEAGNAAKRLVLDVVTHTRWNSELHKMELVKIRKFKNPKSTKVKKAQKVRRKAILA